MCRENAAAASDGGRTLNLAIIVLLVPTLTLFIGVFTFALRRRDDETEMPLSPPPAKPRTETVLHISWLERPGPPHWHPN